MLFLVLIIALLPPFMTVTLLLPAVKTDDVCARWQIAGEQIIVCENKNRVDCIGLRYQDGPVVVTIHPYSTIMIPPSCFTGDPAINTCDGINIQELAANEKSEYEVIEHTELSEILEWKVALCEYNPTLHSLVYCLVRNDTPHEIRIFSRWGDDPRYDFSIASCSPGLHLAIPSSQLEHELHFEVVKGGGEEYFSLPYGCDAIKDSKLTSLSAFIKPADRESGSYPSFKLIEPGTDERRK